MRHHHTTEEIQERVSLFVLGVLEAGDAGSFEEHLHVCPVCRTEVQTFQEASSQLAIALPQAKPRAGLRDRLQNSISTNIASMSPIESAPPAGVHLVRAAGGKWRLTECPGIEVKQLYVDPIQEMVTALVRMDAGASYPEHYHAGAEQCLVLKGDLHFGDYVMRAGDFQCLPANSVHGVSHSEQGCLLLVIASQHDEVIL